jgi:hypothetical protein
VHFTSEKTYDLIISISTLEHVGWDEKPRDDRKILHAIENMRTLIASRGGTIMITVPLGYNPTLDKLLKNGAIQFSRQFNLIRISKGNEWREASWETVLATKYNTPMPFANGLLIWYYSNHLRDAHTPMYFSILISLYKRITDYCLLAGKISSL